ncbi:SDR family oxidoreductase [Conexibacter sp. JD483]|uniref:SDR family NAD(P)-dependent oxidoreductase n=1 Tax=unclassified Conexibacter TaxID=2627773 RepID=UPI00271B59E3|nr:MULTISPECIES: SDR family oxidoreductase [unclassified Conexibacter]MDO8186804.1 SDR family oxidoreductase [Conexibacter sp. CPCC 205706]MDO8197442.1 SDR family oxidoreductase [Conexibacter sp. CPCC 205762]MDR9370457.1 SDR family oxidoreductase [Conexibacter sp. JD483]
MESPHRPGPLLGGRFAVVTGGAAGIGGAIVAAFAAHGAEVLAVDRDEGALAPLAGGAIRTLALDVTADGAAARVLEACGDEAPDVLVNNVGHFLLPPTPFAAGDPAGWEAIEAVNLTHVLRMTRALLPAMVAAGRGGSIVNLTTVEAFRGIPGHAVYAACKAAVTQFGRSLALEVGRHGIRVNAIAPDVVETPQLPYSDWVPEQERWRWRTWAPLARHGTADDVAGAALFLASPLGAFVTGTTVHVDGGTLAAGGWYPRHGGGWTNRPLDP